MSLGAQMESSTLILESVHPKNPGSDNVKGREVQIKVRSTGGRGVTDQVHGMRSRELTIFRKESKDDGRRLWRVSSRKCQLRNRNASGPV